MHSNPPFVQFKEEPLTLREQFAAIGGKAVRHNFGKRGYNPGLARNLFATAYSFLASDYLMTVRWQEVADRIAVSRLSLCGVQASGRTRWVAPLELEPIVAMGSPMQEDGRLFWLNGALMLAYSNVRLRSNGVTFKQSLVSLSPPSELDTLSFKASPMFPLDYGNNAPDKCGHEKNWQFFDDNGELAFVYSIHPHVVITPADGKHYVTRSQAAEDWTKTWGEMHGGTPPIPLPDGRYLSFFNSFVGHVEHQRRYMIGAYIFAGRGLNYKVTHIISNPLVIGSERDGFLWESPTYWEPIVAFATGAILEGDSLRLSYGVNDCYAETATFPLSALLSRMVRI